MRLAVIDLSYYVCSSLNPSLACDRVQSGPIGVYHIDSQVHECLQDIANVTWVDVILCFDSCQTYRI